MKKFLLYVVVAITLVFLGFTIYYIAQNDEKIYLNIDASQTIYKNKSEYIDWPIVHERPYKDTTLTVLVGDESVLKYDTISKRFSCIGGGKTSVTITSSNKDFGPFVFQVNVGDGQLGSPYMIQTASDLAKIGTGDFTTDKYYALAEDIDINTLDNKIWTPIAEFSGNFNGNGKTIRNLNLVSGANAGLFGTISSTGVVENVKFEKVAINGEYDQVGVVAGTNYGLIGKVEVSGTINNTKVGGITGGITALNLYDKTTAFVNMCSAELTVQTEGVFGGLVGVNTSSVIANSRVILNGCTSTTPVVVGGLVGENKSTYADELHFPSAIVRSYAIINAFTLPESSVGAVVGLNTENNNGNNLFANEYTNVIYALGDGLSLTASATGDIKNISADITKTDLKNKETYLNFDFDNVWEIAENDYARINYLGAYETIVIKSSSNKFNSETKPFIDFINAIKEDKTNASAYYVTKQEVIDLNGAEWETIAPIAEEPFLASIIVEEGASLVIKNFKISALNTSFFGHIGAGAMIDGITFENVIMDTTTDASSAVVASHVQAGATIQNVTAKNITFNSLATTVGGIAGVNSGTVKNCTMDGTNNITTHSVVGTQKHIGGIVAYNYGAVSGSIVNSFKLIIDITSEGGNFNIGGIAGSSESTITNCKVNSFEVDSSNNGLMFVGGVVGYATTNGQQQIKHSYSKANMALSINSGNTFVGGVAGYLSAGFKVTESAYVAGTAKAYDVGGIVAVCDGEITESYANATLRGILVAGIATVTQGRISNCYTFCAMFGENSNSKLSGITHIVGTSCSIDRCLSSASFNGKGDYYAESATEFRASFIPKLILQKEYGSVSNLIIINYGKARIQGSILGGRSGWIDVTDEDCKGKDDYAVLKNKADFKPEIWNFSNNGAYPTLKNAVVVE